MNSIHANIERHITQMDIFPSSLSLMNRLLEMFKQADRDIDQVAELLSHDPPIAMEVLRRCNSGALGGSRQVTDIFEGISLLGFYEIYQIVVQKCGTHLMSGQRKDAALDFDLLWRHSVMTAVVASLLAKRVKEPEADAYTAGLFHDVGKIVLANADPAAYRRLGQSQFGSDQDVVELERSLFDINHAEVGAKILARWNIPSEIVMCVHRHHTVSTGRSFAKLATVVHLANRLAHHLAASPTGSEEVLAANRDALEFLALPAEQLSALLREASPLCAKALATIGNPGGGPG